MRTTGNFRLTSQGLQLGDTTLAEFCSQQAGSGPLYLYDFAWIEAQYQSLDQALASHLPHGHQISYAMKANDAIGVLKLLGGLGAGADIVSGGELDRALAADIPADKIVFAGVGKTVAEIEKALIVGIQQFNVESLGELERIAAVAKRLELVAPIALRTNPDVDAKTLAKITTGTKANKFGLPLEEIPAIAERVKADPNLVLVAVAMHIGSQITQIEPYDEAYRRMAQLVERLQDQGHQLSRIDVGGGTGVDYGEGERAQNLSFDDFAQAVATHLSRFELPILVEPGRCMVAECGAMLSEVQYVKHSYGRRFAIVNGGMQTLIRPALYEASHPIFAVDHGADAAHSACDLVGPICESTDIFAKQIPLPDDLKPGDWIAILSAGAYGHVMATQYNGHDLPALWAWQDGQARLIRPAQGDTLLAQELALGLTA